MLKSVLFTGEIDAKQSLDVMIVDITNAFMQLQVASINKKISMNT